ncbi:MAG TPA: glycosyltransferase family 2 protein [Burkholderiaceae bacterium]|jgi:GT2 family glycosyltransferase|nr:glycosyltransferase family 2 protein [Burkholderiaceae bacterium]
MLLTQVSRWNRTRLQRRHARQRRIEIATPVAENYRRWIDRFDTLTPTVLESFRLRERMLRTRPIVSVLLCTSQASAQQLDGAIASVREQIYGEWELCIADDGSSSPGALEHARELAAGDSRITLTVCRDGASACDAANAALARASGDFVTQIEQDSLLRPHSLLLVAEAVNRFPEASVFYSDEDRIDAAGVRREHYFKSDWNAFLLRSHHFLGHLTVFRRQLATQVGGYRAGFDAALDYDLALRCIERVSARAIVHLPFVLYHGRLRDGVPPWHLEGEPAGVGAAERALQDHLARLGIGGDVSATSCGYRVHYALPQPQPRVTLIVPTRDQAELLQTCIDSILSKTSYENYEILIVDNGSTQPQALQYLEHLSSHPRVRLLRDASEFNYSRLNNFAVAHTDAEFICLLNNDIEVITPRWLTEMVSIARQQGVGTVGAKLLYPNGELQHAGVIMGIFGLADHAHKHYSTNHPGYTGRANLVQEMCAVTGACLVMRRSAYLEAGGLDEHNLAVEFNDVDMCLRLRQLGYVNVWTPYARLYHHESVSRGAPDAPAKRARSMQEAEFMRYRWADVIRHDPAYNPNLTLADGSFTLAFPPRVSLTDPYWFKHLERRRGS